MCVYVPEDEHQLAAAEQHTPLAEERDTNQRAIALAWTLVHSYDSHLPGACAGPDGDPGNGAVRDLITLRSRICKD